MSVHADSVTSTVLSTLGHITYSSGLVRALVPCPASVVRPAAGESTQHNTIRRFGGRVEPPAPSKVVPPACRRHTAAAPEADPPFLVGPGDVRPLEAVVLAKGHDVAHACHVTSAEERNRAA